MICRVDDEAMDDLLQRLRCIGRRSTRVLAALVVTLTVLVTVPQQANAAGIDTDGDSVTDDIDIDDDGDGLIDLTETKADFTYASWNPISGNTATGAIDDIGFTYTSSVAIQTSPSIYRSDIFPAKYNVPAGDLAIRNTLQSTNTITFTEPALNPTVILASIGSPTTPVGVQFDRPVEVLFSATEFGGTFRIDSSTRITGAEGFAVIKIPGEHSSFSFDYLADETYVNFAFGADPRAGADSDGDALSDNIDLDADGDGITDNVEAQTTAGYLAPSGIDSDGNGLDDAYESAPGAGEGLAAVDTDDDDDPDFQDVDSDGDGTDDIAERGDGQPTSLTSTADADGDGLVDVFEAGTPNDGRDINDANRDSDSISLAGDHLLKADGSNAVPMSLDSLFRDAEVDTDADDDGIADGIELVDGVSDPANTDSTGEPDHLDADSDDDGIGDSVEYAIDTTAVDFSVDSDHDGLPDAIDADSTAGTDANADGVIDTFAPVDTDDDTTPDYRDLDADDDGVNDATESTTDTDSDATPDFRDLDSDNDGNTDDTDPNRTVATAVDESTVALSGVAVSFDVLANDDFVPGPSTSITVTGGDAAGTVNTDPTTGELTYTATNTESGSPTIVYEVCNTAVSPQVCHEATVTLSIVGTGTDSDGDGLPDHIEFDGDPNDPPDSDGDGIADYLDTDSDNDGVPDASDPFPSAATAADDNGGTVVQGESVVIDVLANDDFVHGSSTSITVTGGDAAGTVNTDPSTGEVTYTATSTEIGVKTIVYEVCNTAVSPQVCDQATVTVTITVVVPPTYEVGGRVFLDQNRDGVVDPDEADISGIGLWLIGPGPDQQLGTDDDVKLQRTTTASPYRFENVTRGDYLIAIDESSLPVGVYFTSDSDGGSDQTIAVTVDEESTSDLNFGQNYAAIGGVFKDANGSPIGGAEITITDQAGNRLVVVTGADGSFAVEGSAAEPLVLGSVTVVGPTPSGESVTREVPLVAGTSPAEIELRVDVPATLAYTGAEANLLMLYGLTFVMVGGAVQLLGRRRGPVVPAPVPTRVPTIR